MKKAIHFSIILITMAFSMQFLATADAEVFISEFLAANKKSLVDGDGERSGWIEITNADSEPVDLRGWHLTNDESQLQKWALPDISLAPGSGGMVIFASGKNKKDGAGFWHTNFTLKKNGGFLALTDSSGNIVHSFRHYPAQFNDVAYGQSVEHLGRLVNADQPALVHFPQDESLGTGWQGGDDDFPDHDRNVWQEVTNGVGYDDIAPTSGSFSSQVYFPFNGSFLSVDNQFESRGFEVNFSSDTPHQRPGDQSLSFTNAKGSFASTKIDVSETAYSVSLWFKTSTENVGIFSVVDPDLGADGHDRNIALISGNSGQDIMARTWDNETIRSQNLNLADGRWHHVVHVIGQKTQGQALYVDGALVAKGSKSRSAFTWQSRINIGYSADARLRHFDGLIDDVGVFSKELDQGQIQALSRGINPGEVSHYNYIYRSDIGQHMRDKASSVYVRIPFEVDDLSSVDDLALRLNYEDGFWLYINGNLAASANVPSLETFDALAPLDRPRVEGYKTEHWQSPLLKSFLRQGKNILALHGVNHRKEDPEFLLYPRLVKTRVRENRFLTTPTPRALNSSGVIGFLPPVQLSQQHGFFDRPFDLTITATNPEAKIYYTLDGSMPAPNNPSAKLYDGRIVITTTTILRVTSHVEEYAPSVPQTQTYVFPADVQNQSKLPAGFPEKWGSSFPADYEVDPRVAQTTLPGYSLADALRSLPTLSVVADRADLFGDRGIYSHSGSKGPEWERPSSIELFFPDGQQGFQIDATLQMHGNSSRHHGFTPKHSFRMEFNRGGDLEYQLFPDSPRKSFDELHLRGMSTDSWAAVNGELSGGINRWRTEEAQYIRDAWMRQTHIDLGHHAPHGIFVHVYLNGLYWGIYQLMERADHSFNAFHYGGKKSDYDVMKDFGELVGNSQITPWHELFRLATAGFENNRDYFFAQGKNESGQRDPSIPKLFDQQNLIDYMIYHIYAGAEDWPCHNYWAARRRGSDSNGYLFFPWDQEISNNSLERKVTFCRHHVEVLPGEEQKLNHSPAYLYAQLRKNSLFRAAFKDRIDELMLQDGPLSANENHRRWMKLANVIDKAIVAESARWGDTRRSTPYKREVEWLKNQNWLRDEYWPKNHDVALQRFRNAGLYP